jgi:hypothetical protein
VVVRVEQFTMANADVTQITLRTLSLLICVALIAISVYLVAGVERKDTRWMVSCPPVSIFHPLALVGFRSEVPSSRRLQCLAGI